MIQFTCTDNIGNRVKRCENLKKKLKGIVSQQVLLKFVQNKNFRFLRLSYP